jgi:hypothetical protein
VTSKSIYYDPETGALTAKNESACIIDQVILYDPPYDALMAWLWHNHVCGGSSPGYLITNYIYENFPIGEDESYSLIGNSISCRDDIYSYLLGISPGLGTYYSQRMTSKTTGNDILVLSVYDSKTKTRRVAIINWKNPSFERGSNSYEEYIRLYWGDTSSPNLKSAPVISLTADTWVTEEEWAKIIAGGEGSLNTLEYIKGLPVRSQQDLIKMQGGSQIDGPTIPGTESSGSGSSPGSSIISRGGSVGDSGAAVSAVSVSAAVGEEAGDSGKAYEVTQAGSEGAGNSPWGTAAIVGVMAVLALGAFGFLFKSGFLGR